MAVSVLEQRVLKRGIISPLPPVFSVKMRKKEVNQLQEEIRKRLPLIAIVGLATVLVFNAVILYPAAGAGLPPEIAEANIGEEENILVVSGEGTVTVEPDRAKLYVSVQTRASTAETAQRENADKLSAVVQTLVALGIAKGDMETVSYSLTPIVHYPDSYIWHPENDSTPRVIGYLCTNEMLVTVTNLDLVGSAIDAATQAGANNIYGIQFTVSEEKLGEMRREAMRRAVVDARGKAEVTAEALGVQILRPTSVNFNTWYPIIAYKAFDLAQGAAAPETAILPGDLRVTANVQITYAIA